MSAEDFVLETVLMRSLLHILDDGMGMLVDDEKGERYVVYRRDANGTRNLGVSPASDFNAEIHSMPVGSYVMLYPKSEEELKKMH